MTTALTLAARGLGQVAPNPAVGAVLVRGGQVVGRGWTQPGGRPHAETEALRRAGDAARGSTAYVTLEPCSHHGKTGPCADALVAAGVSRCVVACLDSDPRVSGRGVEKLRQAGVEVALGVLEEDARALNAGFFLQKEKGRPLVTLKVATTLDGMIATHTGHSQWITGEAARERGHLLRAQSDAILVGSGTAVADNPRLDVRLPGLDSRRPLRVVLDGRLRLPLTHDLVTRSESHPTLLITREDAPAERLALYQDSGVEVMQLAPASQGNLPLEAVLVGLAEKGITRLMVEGGAHLSAALLQAQRVDRLYWFRASKVIGGDGHPAALGFGVDQLDQAARFDCVSREVLGQDLLEIFTARHEI
ncbi:bifunctional diaminohydroxyphosphoribosylaminopyrimidine deaminase/5-amino-6-(5-phosphoribosylamino)uracil reductase RibD [Rhodovibrionaceae bacterium A322]